VLKFRWATLILSSTSSLVVDFLSDYSEWDATYRSYPLEELGWELGKPRPILVEHVENGAIPVGVALDTCCGAGTNPVYLAEKGFEVTGIDISLTAIGLAREEARRRKVAINFLSESFVNLSFRDGAFGFVHDMGCFHHVHAEDRTRFIEGIHRVLKDSGVYMLTCFSYQNGSGWNHFTGQQLWSLFGGHFDFQEIQHYPSLEGDGVTRFFYTVLMKKKRA
jgi:SAM-dependent methyltransferase